MAVQGHTDEQFAPVREALAEHVESETECGAAVSVDVAGTTVVDLWGGFADAARTRPWERDTVVNVWSTSKCVTALAVLICADRGLLDLDAPVATYWPEFAQNGKEEVLVAHVMSHTSGVAGWEHPFRTADLYELESATSRLAAQAPWWPPGSASGYHALSQGHLLGEVIRRVTGTSLTDFVATEITKPLGVDLRLGAHSVEESRIAEIIPPPPIESQRLDPDSPAVKTFTAPALHPAAANTEAFRHAELGALNVHTHARALAKVFSAVSNGGAVDGVRLLSATTIERIFESYSDGVDLVLGVPLRFGIGFALPEPRTIPYVPAGEKVCFWGGWGGSLTVMFPERHLTFSYVMNKMAPGIIGSTRAERYLTTVLDCLF